MEFNFQSDLKDGYCILEINGNLLDQLQASSLLRDVDDMIEEGQNKMIVDMSNSEYITSSGLNVLINILTKTRIAGGDTIICCVPKRIEELLIVTRLNNVFTVAKNLSKAKKLIKKING